MAHFILNKNAQPGGEHEVHNLDVYCGHLPNPENQISLGNHGGCREAVRYAKSRYPAAAIDGCAYCTPVCHTR
jgi:hypothetical protein